MGAVLRWSDGSLSVLQGSIGDPGPAGYSGMKVKCTYVNKSEEANLQMSISGGKIHFVTAA